MLCLLLMTCNNPAPLETRICGVPEGCDRERYLLSRLIWRKFSLRPRLRTHRWREAQWQRRRPWRSALSLSERAMF
jgi:hypothetical protein